MGLCTALKNFLDMNRLSTDKYVAKMNEVKKQLDEVYEDNTLQGDRTLQKLLGFRDFIHKNEFDLILRHKDLYEKEFLPMSKLIKKERTDRRGRLEKEINESTKPFLTLANLLKTRGLWLIEDLARSNDTVKSLYVKLATGIDKEDNANSETRRKRVVAINPDGEETVYDSAYKAALDLDIHSGSIAKCCLGMDYRVSANSKKDGRTYRFRYEGEELSRPLAKSLPKVRRANVGKIDKVLKKYETD